MFAIRLPSWAYAFALFVVLLGMGARSVWVSSHTDVRGLDFYLYWSIGQAQAWNADLKSPYIEADRYRTTIEAHRLKSEDWRLKEVASHSDPMDITTSIPGTPLAFTIFGYLPSEFSNALGFYSGLQVFLLAASGAALALSVGRRRWMYFVLCLSVIPFYKPIAADLQFGNMSIVQLFLVTTAAALLLKAQKSFADNLSVLWGSASLCVLAFLMLLKPTLLPAAAFIFLSFLHSKKPHIVLKSCCAALLFAGALIALSSYRYGSNVWIDWFRYMEVLNQRQFYPVERGNISSTAVLSSVFQLPYTGSFVLICGILSSFAVYALVRCRFGRLWSRLCNDPLFGAALGVTVSLAVSPLVWYQYQVVLLIPIFWILGHAPIRSAQMLFALGGLGLASGEAAFVFSNVNWDKDVLLLMASFSWLPLWCALMLFAFDGAREAASNFARSKDGCTGGCVVP